MLDAVLDRERSPVSEFLYLKRTYCLLHSLNRMREFHWGKYIFVFLITVSVFGTAIAVNNFFYARRLNEVDSVERRITLNLLSSEVQFELLSEASCAASSSPILTDEINTLAAQLEFLEGSRGRSDAEVLSVKERYSLLQIKDLLLVKEIAKRCGGKVYTIVYFYSNKPGSCDDCERQGYVLSALRKDYPDLRVYTFDYDLDLGGISALKKIYGIGGALPAIIIDHKVHSGFHGIEELGRLLPGLATSSVKSTQ